MAGRFKHAVTLALDNIDLWLARTPMRHVKNDFAAETAYGCEDYAYFDKYMVTTASFLYAASLICDDGIAAQAAAPRVSAAATSATFHKLFLRAEPYFCQLELSADPHYDAAGLGRVHCAGVPSPLCLSLPAPADPRYTVDGDAPIPFAICPSVLCTGAWHDGCSAVYTVAHLGRDPRAATAVLDTCIEDTPARMTVTVTPSGVTVTAEAEGTVGLLLPAFAFDGTTETAIDCATDTLTVTYVGHRCTILTDGDLTDTGRLARNRNGHYRICRAVGQGRVSATITLV